MANLFSQVVVLAEDQEHQLLVRRYLQRVDRHYKPPRVRLLPLTSKCGSQYVREQFPIQVKECRRLLAKASCLLVVITDADNLTTRRREQTLHEELKTSGQATVASNEPIAVFIPKWQVETWIKCLLGESVNESDKTTDRPPVKPPQIAEAAQTLFDWARPNAKVSGTCVASLTSALPRWRMLG